MECTYIITSLCSCDLVDGVGNAFMRRHLEIIFFFDDHLLGKTVAINFTFTAAKLLTHIGIRLLIISVQQVQ
jgi:hypothetical protein